MITHRAMAIKCRTALVEPPSAITITIAFRNDFSVIMSLGFKSIFSNSKRYFPARWHSSSFSGSSAGVEELCYIKTAKSIEKSQNTSSKHIYINKKHIYCLVTNEKKIQI